MYKFYYKEGSYLIVGKDIYYEFVLISGRWMLHRIKDSIDDKSFDLGESCTLADIPREATNILTPIEIAQLRLDK